MVNPPLTLSTCPVIQEARSEARKATAEATSSGSPNLRRGYMRSTLRTRSA